MRRAWIVPLLAAPLCAQLAQLPRKGRQFDRTAPRSLTPIRKLPQRGGAHEPLGPSPLQQEIARRRATLQPEPALAGDRVSKLERRVPDYSPPSPVPTIEEAGVLYPLPHAPAGTIFEPTPLPVIQAQEIPNRWRIANPDTRRYDDPKIDATYAPSHLWDPFNRSTLKGDFPIFGRHNFLDISVSSETLVEDRMVPVASPASSVEPGEPGFFGRGDQLAVVQNFRVSLDFFGGSAGFKPVSYDLRITPEFDVNYLLVRENAITNANVQDGIHRTDTSVGMQELFFEKRLFTNSSSAFRRADATDETGSAYFDFTSVRVGIQRFTSDFRGFIFSDEQPGARLFGTLKDNKYQYNLAFFNMIEKDANSGLNRWRSREQKVFIANLYRTDFLFPGYNFNFSALFNDDPPSLLIDKDGFIVRPTPIGLLDLGEAPPLRQGIRAGYVGVTGDGHIGRINVSNAFYQAFGTLSRNPFDVLPPQREMHINAQLAALELSYEKDWMTYRASFFFTSGDGNPLGTHATGFDGIVPNQQFAGGGFLGSQALADRGLINNAFEAGGVNFLNREAIPLTSTGVFLFGPNSLIPNMRGGLFEGQANFQNPGVLLYNAGMDAKITPKLRSSLNVNYLKFDRTEVLEAVLFQSHIPSSIGVDAGLGLQYRPLLSDNIVITSGFGALFPGQGFRDIYNGRVFFSAFINLRLVF